jgi:hypothetical protein
VGRHLSGHSLLGPYSLRNCRGNGATELTTEQEKRKRHCEDIDGTVVSVDWVDFLLLGLGRPVLLGYAFRTFGYVPLHSAGV